MFKHWCQNNRNRLNKLYLIIGKETSRFGNILFDYANSITIVNLFKTNALFLAIYQSSETIISIIFSLLGGVFADQGNKKRLLISTDILSATICIMVALLVKSQIIAVIIIIANILLAIVNAFNSPVYSSIIRDTIYIDDIPQFNSLKNGISEIVKMSGAIIAAAMISIIGTQGALFLDAITFILSAIIESRLVILMHSNYKTSKKNVNVLYNIKEGLIYLYSQKGICKIILIATIVNFFLAGYTLLVPYTNLFYINKVPDFYSKVLMVEAIGGILGSLLNSKMKWKNETRALSCFLLLIGLVVSSIPIISNAQSYIICLLPHLLAATIVAIYNIRFISIIQMSISTEFLGRVCSIISVTSLIFVPAGAFVFANICNVTNMVGYLYIGISLIVVGAISWFLN